MARYTIDCGSEKWSTSSVKRKQQKPAINRKRSIDSGGHTDGWVFGLWVIGFYLREIAPYASISF
jgi:hypothetical protein